MASAVRRRIAAIASQACSRLGNRPIFSSGLVYHDFICGVYPRPFLESKELLVLAGNNRLYNLILRCFIACLGAFRADAKN